MRISDREVLDKLVARFETPLAAAKALGLSDQFYYNWRVRGVPRGWRRAIWMICRQRKIVIDEEWCVTKKTPAQRAAALKALRSLRHRIASRREASAPNVAA
jgi:hypothetical protein